MKKFILSPVDFSTVSLNAVQYAANLANELKVDLTLLHVVQMPIVYGEIAIPIGDYDAVMAQAEEQLKSLVRDLSHQFNEELFVQHQIKVGSPVYEIAKESEEAKPLFLVMGTRGLSGIDKFLMGSVTLSLVKESSVPVLVIPDKYKFNPVQKLGFASDLHGVVEDTDESGIKRILDYFDAELHIIHNDPNYHEYEPEYVEQGLMLDTMFSAKKHRFHFIHQEFTEEGIIQFAKKNDIEWLIVQPKRHGFFDELFGHQHTRSFVLHAELPICILPTRDMQSPL